MLAGFLRAKSRRKEPEPVATLAENPIRLLEHGDPRPLQAPRIDADALLVHHHLEPVVETADHDSAHRTDRRDLLARGLTTAKSSLDTLRNGDALRKREANGRVDAHASIRRLLHGRNARGGGRDLHDH